MAERLGEMLLQGGALTEAELEEVLSAQSVYGGRLGTNLVEMGLLSEDNLARLLNQKLGVPSVDSKSLETVPSSVLDLLPQDMVRRFQVLPLALEGKKLVLAMADPADYNAIDEIGFFTGLVVVPRVCSELRLSMAMERYYGIKRVLHFIPVAGGVRTRMVNATRESAGLAPSVVIPARASIDAPAPGPSHSYPGAGTGVSCHQNTGAGASLGTRTKAGGHAGAAADASGATGSAAGSWRLGMEAVANKFAAASSGTEVVAALMSYLREEFDCAGFLGLRRDSAIGVRAVAEGAEIPTFGGYLVGLNKAELLKTVLRERTPYVGTLTENTTEWEILAKIGGKPGAPALLLPLVIGGVTLAFLVVEDEKGRLGPGLFDLQRVVAKAELAFEMLGLRKKISLV